MELFILNKTTLGELNKAFQKYFPFLKLEFYLTEYLSGRVSFCGEKLNSTTKFRDIFENFLPVLIEFKSTDTVKQFQKRFKEKTGLAVEVFRRLNNEWIAISYSSDKSLEKQNAFGSIKFQPHYNDYTLFL